MTVVATAAVHPQSTLKLGQAEPNTTLALQMHCRFGLHMLWLYVGCMLNPSCSADTDRWRILYQFALSLAELHLCLCATLSLSRSNTFLPTNSLMSSRNRTGIRRTRTGCLREASLLLLIAAWSAYLATSLQPVGRARSAAMRYALSLFYSNRCQSMRAHAEGNT